VASEALAPSGVYRRSILLCATAADEVVADLEDDFHRFGVVLRHDGQKVLSVEGSAERYPWSECPGAIETLKQLAGIPLPHRATDIGRYADARRHCTHLFDLAGLAVAHAGSGRPDRRYDVAVPDRDALGRTRARGFRDGELVLEWALDGMTITSPPPFDGMTLQRGFLRWADSHLDAETAEAATVLRRACIISMGRGTPWDDLGVAADVGASILGTCHTFQPGRAEVAVRMKGTIRDFTNAPDAPLGERGPSSAQGHG